MLFSVVVGLKLHAAAVMPFLGDEPLFFRMYLGTSCCVLFEAVPAQ
jgi:hypothetical protein